MYPFLKKEIKKFEKKNNEKKILVYDIPLIYETKSQNNYDLILLANCDQKTQFHPIWATVEHTFENTIEIVRLPLVLGGPQFSYVED